MLPTFLIQLRCPVWLLLTNRWVGQLQKRYKVSLGYKIAIAGTVAFTHFLCLERKCENINLVDGLGANQPTEL